MTEATRRLLRTTSLDAPFPIHQVVVHEIQVQAGQQTGLQIHPGPVLGFVRTGTIRFAGEALPARVVHAGEAFIEPAATRIRHFDAQDTPATFVALYLLGTDDDALIRML